MPGNEDSLRRLGASDAISTLDQTRKPYLILKYSHESADSFLDALRVVRSERGAGRGALTDEEQDLLRMMVVITAAGLDSLLKQLIRDCLPELAKFDEGVRQELETFVSRQLRGESDEVNAPISNRFLAKILIADSHQTQVIEEYVRYLTGSSLQAAEEVMKATKALGVQPKVAKVNVQALKEIFGIRNKIIHELDIDFDGARRNRRQRRINDMVSRTNVLLELSEKILVAVHSKLTEEAD